MGDQFRSTILLFLSPSIAAPLFGLELEVDPYDFVSTCFMLFDSDEDLVGVNFLAKGSLLVIGVVLEVVVAWVELGAGTIEGHPVSSEISV